MADLQDNLPEKVQQVIGDLENGGHLSPQIKPLVQDYLLGNPVEADKIGTDNHDNFTKAVTRGLQALNAQTSIGLSDKNDKNFYIRQDLPDWKDKVASNLPVTTAQAPADENNIYVRLSTYNTFTAQVDKETGNAFTNFADTLKAMYSSPSDADLTELNQQLSSHLLSIYGAVKDDPKKLQTLSNWVTDLGLREHAQFQDVVNEYLPLKKDEPQTTPAVHKISDEVMPSAKTTSFNF